MPPKKQKLPSSVRRYATEFLQPTHSQQNQLRDQYSEWRTQNMFANTLASVGWTDQERHFRQLSEVAKTRYHELLQKYTSSGGLHETYQYFWDDEKPWPDQPGGTGGGGVITS